MMFLLKLVPAFIPPQFRKAFVVGALVLAFLSVLAVGKCTYDRSIIKQHDAKREAQIAKADRKADAIAAVQRRADDARISTEREEIKEAVNEAPDPAAKRRAYYACLAKLQDARARNLAPPDC